MRIRVDETTTQIRRSDVESGGHSNNGLRSLLFGASFATRDALAKGNAIGRVGHAINKSEERERLTACHPKRGMEKDNRTTRRGSEANGAHSDALNTRPPATKRLNVAAPAQH